MKEATYSIEEYAKQPESLNSSEDIIRAAFAYAKVTNADMKEAKKLVIDFKNKEVE